MQIPKLTDSAIAKAKPQSKPYQISQHKALNRLACIVSVAGSKTWRWSYRINGKDKAAILGTFPAMSVKAAEARADALRLILDMHGIDPLEYEAKVEAEKEAALLAAELKAKLEAKSTLWKATRDWWRANRHPKKWGHYYSCQALRHMRRYVRDSEFKDRHIKTITTADIFALVNAIADRKGGALTKEQLEERGWKNAKGAPTVAMLVKQWLDQIFQRAIAMGLCENNPVTGLKTGIAVNTKKPTKHNTKLTPAQLGDLLGSLSDYKGGLYGGQYFTGRTAIAIELLVLFFVRTGELRQAQWNEFDFINRVWTVPASRMKIKTGYDHKVPLSDQAIVILHKLRAMGVPKEGPQWLFPNTRDPMKCMDARTINQLLERKGFNGPGSVEFSAHGCRGTASTLLHESLKYQPAVIEAQLAHVVPGVAGAYNAAAYLTERTKMMQDWADYVDTLRVEQSAQTVAA